MARLLRRRQQERTLVVPSKWNAPAASHRDDHERNTVQRHSLLYPSAFCCDPRAQLLDQVAAQAPTGSPTQERVIGEDKPIVAKSVEPSVQTALVVDDSSTVRKQIELELKLFGIEVDAVESGEQAFESLAQKSYDLIFLDVVLPGIDGYQICKNIKKDKARKKTPVIMLTSKSSPFDRIKGALAGCDTYLTKPVKQTAFQKVIKKHLKSS
jgi:twitching motility two-component system response regulator PilG